MIKVCTEAEYQECGIVPMVFFRGGRPTAGMDATFNCHGDDFLAEGTSRALGRLDDVLTQSFDTKVLPRNGPPAAGGQVTVASTSDEPFDGRRRASSGTVLSATWTRPSH